MTEELREEAKVLLKRVREALAGLLLEMRQGNKRHQDTLDFQIAELRDLVRAVRALLKKMEAQK